jgi:2,4-dienoyl-CoA reductase-like NADH-dependent reductase (Old Yellow Enzyme family)
MKLFEPAAIGKLTIKNRIYMLPMRRFFWSLMGVYPRGQLIITLPAQKVVSGPFQLRFGW